MNANRNFRFVGILALALLAVSLAPTSASAQTFKGYFTLPVETRWGTAVLPPGTYSVSLDSLAFPSIAKINGEDAHFLVMAMGVDAGEPSDQCKLVIARSGGKARVRNLSLGTAGMSFSYAPPKREREVIAQGPELIERLPITMGGK